MSTQTVRIRAGEIYKDWHVIDAAGRPLGRVATEAATLRQELATTQERLAATDAVSVKSDAKLNYAEAVGIGYQAITVNVGNGERAILIGVEGDDFGCCEAAAWVSSDGVDWTLADGPVPSLVTAGPAGFVGALNAGGVGRFMVSADGRTWTPVAGRFPEYSAAWARLAELVAEVYTVERLSSLQEHARQVLAGLGVSSVVIPRTGKPSAKRAEIIVYCRGPFCVFADEAVALLTKAGYKAKRLEEGYPDWRMKGLPVEANRAN